MEVKQHRNIELLSRVAKEIGPLLEKVVFVGGTTTTLYILCQEHIAHARGTIDVDVILNASRVGFYKAEKIMRKQGFEHDPTTIHRFIKDDLIVDLMPTDSTVLGFSNRWYEEGFKKAEVVDIGGTQIKMLCFPYFLATKLEAFNGRGKGDYYGSKDMEDIITVLAGRKGFLLELIDLKGEIKEFLQKEFTKLLNEREFRDALHGHMPLIEGVDSILTGIQSDLVEFSQLNS